METKTLTIECLDETSDNLSLPEIISLPEVEGYITEMMANDKSIDSVEVAWRDGRRECAPIFREQKDGGYFLPVNWFA